MKGAMMAKYSKDWLLGIPIQVGPPTQLAQQYAKAHFPIVLGLLVVTAILRLVVLWDITGTCWMLFVAGIGFYAWRQGMNITVVSVKGVLCMGGGVIETLNLVVPVALGVIKYKLGQIFVMAMIPISFFIGAFICWLLYKDYMSNGHGQNSQTLFDVIKVGKAALGSTETQPLNASSQIPNFRNQFYQTVAGPSQAPPASAAPLLASGASLAAASQGPDRSGQALDFQAPPARGPQASHPAFSTQPSPDPNQYENREKHYLADNPFLV